MSKKKVLVLSHMFPRDYAPANGIFVKEQVKKFNKKYHADYQLQVLVGEPLWLNTFNVFKLLRAARDFFKSKKEFSWLIEDGIEYGFFYYPASRFLRFINPSVFYSYGLKRIAKAIKADQYHLIHAHTAYMDGNAAYNLSSLYSIPYIITEHTGPFTIISGYKRRKKLAKRSLSSAKKVLSVSHKLKNDITEQMDFNNLAIEVIPNGVDTQYFTPGFSSDVKPQKIKACWVGHHVPIKQVDMLIDAFSKVQNENIELHLIGIDRDEKNLVKTIKKLGIDHKVKLYPVQSRKHLSQLLKTMDFLVISSKEETFGVVAIEALSAGLPVLTTDCGGPAEVIREPFLGRVVDNSSKGLETGFEYMIENIDEFDHEKIREFALKNYSYDVISEKLLDIYEKETA